jgi:hypothetical protein
MIRVFFLIFEPAVAWEKIAKAQRGYAFVLGTYVLPFVLLATVLEGWGLMKWGRWQPRFNRIKIFTDQQVVVHFEIMQAVIFLLVIFISALLLRFACEQFHGQRKFRDTLTVMAYSFGPTMLFHLVNLFPTVHPVVGWIIGTVLSLFVLYAGVPRVMQPLPVHAFGAYMSAVFILLLMSGLARIFTAMFLLGQINFSHSAATRALGHWLGQ